VGRFLLAFEKILTGADDSPGNQIIRSNNQNLPGLEAIIRRIHTYFSPDFTPPEFLPWLAGWVALSLRDDWNEESQRAFIREIVPLYKLRGTKRGLEAILQIYLRNAGFSEEVQIFDQFNDLPNYFQVELRLSQLNPDEYWRKARIAKAIIDQEKPAHTFYALRILVPTLRITLNPKENYRDYFFTLIAPAPEVLITFEIVFESTSINQQIIPNLEKSLVVYLQGKSAQTGADKKVTVTSGRLKVTQNISYQSLLDNSDGFNLVVSNFTDIPISGTLIINRQVKLNGKSVESEQKRCLEQQVNLSPVLRICARNSDGKITGTTRTQADGMQITKFVKESYPVTLQPPDTQEFKIQTTIEFTSLELTSALSKQIQDGLSVRVRGKTSQSLIFSDVKSRVVERKLQIDQNLTKQDLDDNPDGFELQILNETGRTITGTASVQLHFKINQTSNFKSPEAIVPLLEEQIELPVLKICTERREELNNTMIAEPPGMQLTKQLEIFPFALFDPFENEQFTIESKVTLNKGHSSKNLMLRIATVKIEEKLSPNLLQSALQARTSRTLLLASKSVGNGNTLECRRTISHQQLMSNIDGFMVPEDHQADMQKMLNGVVVTLTNFNDEDKSEISEISINVCFKINQSQFEYELLKEQQFSIPSAVRESTLRICSKVDSKELQGNTILGTSTQSL
jgi:phage tail-like protein